jgi:hypothetical protein
LVGASPASDAPDPFDYDGFATTFLSSPASSDSLLHAFESYHQSYPLTLDAGCCCLDAFLSFVDCSDPDLRNRVLLVLARVAPSRRVSEFLVSRGLLPLLVHVRPADLPPTLSLLASVARSRVCCHEVVRFFPVDRLLGFARCFPSSTSDLVRIVGCISREPKLEEFQVAKIFDFCRFVLAGPDFPLRHVLVDSLLRVSRCRAVIHYVNRLDLYVLCNNLIESDSAKLVVATLRFIERIFQEVGAIDVASLNFARLALLLKADRPEVQAAALGVWHSILVRGGEILDVAAECDIGGRLLDVLLGGFFQAKVAAVNCLDALRAALPIAEMVPFETQFVEAICETITGEMRSGVVLSAVRILKDMVDCESDRAEETVVQDVIRECLTPEDFHALTEADDVTLRYEAQYLRHCIASGEEDEIG